MTGIPSADLLESFGEALVPGLVQVYGRLVEPGWRTLDLIEHTEATMHTGCAGRTQERLLPASNAVG
jgi:hypothetical protein